jgi:hypothetical protein
MVTNPRATEQTERCSHWLEGLLERLQDFIPDHPDRIEKIVEDALLEEFLLGATLCEAALLKHGDAVSVFHGRQPMRDDEGGAAAPEDRQAGLHKVPRPGVDTERKLYTLEQLFTI